MYNFPNSGNSNSRIDSTKSNNGGGGYFNLFGLKSHHHQQQQHHQLKADPCYEEATLSSQYRAKKCIPDFVNAAFGKYNFRFL